MDGIEHERAFYANFVVAPRRERALLLIDLARRGDVKRRRQLTDPLNHGFEHQLLHKYVVVIPPKRFSPLHLAKAIETATGVSVAHCLSSESHVDGRILPLSEVLGMGHSFGTIASVLPGRLAIFMPEILIGDADRYLLMRDLKAAQVDVLMKAVR